MNNGFVTYFTLFFFLVLLFSSCTSDKLAEPSIDNCIETNYSYNGEIKNIIDNSCALPVCHDDSGLAPGNYLSYNSMLSDLENGEIENQVVTLRAMPLLPGELSEENLEKIKCWLAAGFPE